MELQDETDPEETKEFLVLRVTKESPDYLDKMVLASRVRKESRVTVELTVLLAQMVSQGRLD